MLRRRRGGFTLIELMVALAIGALLLTLIVPLMGTLIANFKIRTAAESLATGIESARAESIKQNTAAELQIVGATWQVDRLVDNLVLDNAAGREALAEVVATSTPAGSVRIGFDSFGQVVAVSPVDGSSAIAQIDVTVANATSLGSELRPLRILVDAGGSVKVCDPSLASTDSRACS